MASEIDKAPAEKPADKPSRTERKMPKPPEISPYIFPFLLAAFGLWCFYDGWLTSNVEMLEHRLFNRVASGILLPWAVYDFLKVRKYDRRQKKKEDVAGKEDSALDK
jgi:hypothetical protein